MNTNKLTSRRIIVIDDDPDILNLVSILLQRIGAQVSTFADGRSAIRYLAQETPDLIVLDLMLPDVDGLDILRQIRARSRFEEVPVLVLSAKADPDTIRTALDSGADSYVTKLYITNSLLDRVRLLLTHGRRSRSLFGH